MSCMRPSRILAAVLLALLPTQLLAEGVSLRRGTQIYGEIDETVSSRKSETSVGDTVRAHVWRDVVVGGRVVIEAGAPLRVRVASMKPAKIFGRKGELTLEAMSVVGVDGLQIALDGGYDRSGTGRKGLAIGLSLLVWPALFIKGKQAVLPSGTVFDASVQTTTEVAVEARQERKPKRVPRRAEEPAAPVEEPAPGASLEIEVLYDEIDPDGKLRLLPMTVRLCGAALGEARVVAVNEQEIEPIPVVLGTPALEAGCTLVGAEVDLRELAKHFGRGINRFEVEIAGSRSEVVLDVEM